MSVVSRYLEPSLVERLNHLQLSARSVVEGTTIGSHKSPVKGASIEFRQHRAYVAGGEPKRLGWGGGGGGGGGCTKGEGGERERRGGWGGGCEGGVGGG